MNIALKTLIFYPCSYRVWHYTGTLLQQVLLEQNHELWETAWQPAPKGAYPERPIRYGVVQAPVDVPQPDGKQLFNTHSQIPKSTHKEL